MKLGAVLSVVLISVQSLAGDFVAVAKHAGGLQCQDMPGVKLEKMKQELDPIQVLRMARRTNANTMQIALCGTPDAWYNVYWIKSSDLELAKKRGFEVFNSAPTQIRSKVVIHRARK